MNYFIKQLLLSAILAVGAGASFAVQASDVVVVKNSVCVKNGSNETYIFAAEVGNSLRVVKKLSAGELLCANPTPSKGASISTDIGVVSVYEKEDSMEGCSRIVELGLVEIMLKFSDADRCLWSSNS